MAYWDQLDLLKSGVDVWNRWRVSNPNEFIELKWANFRGVTLKGVNLRRANLTEADLTETDLQGADLRKANLRRVDLTRADLTGADLREANLRCVDLTGTNLRAANLGGVDLTGAFLRASKYETIFGNTNLKDANGLASVSHGGPSTIDLRTIECSWPLPVVFLRGCGLPETFIDYIPSLIGQPFQFYSCFISYSSKNEDFAKRLHADLQDAGVRCWFAPEDLKIGDKIRYAIDEAIRLRDKLLVVLSEDSIASHWVEAEVEKALDEEARRGELVLFPVRLDDAVMKSQSGWASHLRRTRHIGDFRQWKTHDAYQTSFKRLLRDLKADDD